MAFSGNYRTAYDQPASLAAVAGTYNAQGASTNAGAQAMTVSISPAGAVSSTSLGCAMAGTIKPRASGKNVFDLSITFTGASCRVGSGATLTGAAYYENGSLLALGRQGDSAFVAIGKK